MAESLLVRAQSAGGSSGTQLVLGPAFSQSTVNQNMPCTVNSSSMLMAAVKIYNAQNGSYMQPFPEWFIVVVGDSDIGLPVNMTYSGSSQTIIGAYATMTASSLMITTNSYYTQCGTSGRVFCTA